MAYQSWSVVYGEQPSASKWNILGTNDAHFYSFLGANEAWQSYTPTFTNLSGANNTVVGKYIQIGRWVRASVTVTLGVGFSMSGSAVQVSHPATSVSYSGTARGGCGWLRMFDASSSTSYYGNIRMQTTDYIYALVWYSGGSVVTGSSITSTVPFTWASTDVMNFEWEYEAAA